MTERFTDRFRKVMALANQEACRLNHEYIGTEHILLGLIKEGSGVGATVLKDLNMDLKRIKLDVEKVLKSGPDIVTMGKLPQTPRAKRVIEHSVEYARTLRHYYVGTEHLLYGYVGTEHLLYGLIVENGGVAAQILMNNNLNEDKIKKSLESLLNIPSQSEKVQKIEKSMGYWSIPRKDMSFRKFLETVYGYNLEALGKDTENPHLKISIKDPFKQEVSYIQVGRLGVTMGDPTSCKNNCVMYNVKDEEPINEEDIKQIGYALNLKNIFDNNEVKYKEEPPSSHVLEVLKRPTKNVVPLIERLEKD